LRVGDQFLTPADAVGAFHVSGTPSMYTSFSVESADRLRVIALQKIASAATEGVLLEVPDPASVLVEWRSRGDGADIGRWLEGVAASNEMLPRLLVRFVQRGMSTVVGDRVGRITASINPRMFSPELDLDAVEVRVQAAAQMPGLPSSEREAAQLFLAGMTRMRQRVRWDYLWAISTRRRLAEYAGAERPGR
jgi:hypothetical protein